ncbi:MAG: RNA polymerase sigma factor [Anaerolineales bacterium]
MNAAPSPSYRRFRKPVIDEVSLIGLSQQGDADAFARLYDHYADPIYRYVYFRVADSHLAEDITSQIFIKMWQKLPSYRVGEASISAWLYRIAHNAVVDHYRTRRTVVSLEDLQSGEVGREDDTEENLEQHMQMEQLRRALQELTEGQREVLILRFIEGLSVREIARQLGKRQGAVRALKMRGLRELAKSPTLQIENGSWSEN